MFDFLLQTPPPSAAPAAEAASGGTGGTMMMILPMVLMFVVMYFFMIRPQQKKAKKEQEYRAGLKVGDSVMTIGGIYGKIVQVEDAHVILQVDTNVKIKFDKTAVRSTPLEEQA